jgi:hypothetical protein
MFLAGYPKIADVLLTECGDRPWLAFVAPSAAANTQAARPCIVHGVAFLTTARSATAR